jgi:hypothetical protein
LIVKAYAKRLGLDPKVFSGHSLRAGFLTSAAARGASIFKLMEVSRHKSVDTLRRYVRDADAFRDHAGAGLLCFPNRLGGLGQPGDRSSPETGAIGLAHKENAIEALG